MILRHFWTKTLVFFLFLACTIDLMAAEKFVLFQASPETWQLKNFSVGLSENEHSCVQLAANNLLADIEKVTGQKGTIVLQRRWRS